MSVPERVPGGLVGECRLLHRYLVGTSASTYVVEKYCMAHELVAGLRAPRNRFDGVLTRVAFANGLMLRLGQAYARIFAPASLARKKAVLMLAIVECCATASTVTQQAARRAPLRALSAAALSTAGFAVALIAGAILLAPVQLVMSIASRLQRTAATADVFVNEVA